jgi:hypothetical protein
MIAEACLRRSDLLCSREKRAGTSVCAAARAARDWRRAMSKLVVLWVAAIVTFGVVGRAGAQSVEVPPADQPPPADPTLLPPEAPPPQAPPPAAAPEASPAPSTPSPPPAAPETLVFGAMGHFALSVERAVGIDYISQMSSRAGQDLQKTTATNFSLFGPPGAGAFSLFSFPRAAFDWFFAPNLSIGLGLGLIHGSVSVAPTGPGGPLDESFTGLLVMPRIGYAWRLAPDIAFWPHAGISIAYLKTSISSYPVPVTEDEPVHYVAVTVEAPFVFTLLPRLALTISPTFDVTFNGSQTNNSVDAGSATIDQRVTELGLQAGLLFQI